MRRIKIELRVGRWPSVSFMINVTFFFFFFTYIEALEDLKNGVSVLCFVATMGNLAIISRDRYLAVSKALWYRTHGTRSRVLKQACVVWFLSAVMAVLKYANFSLHAFTFPFFLLCILVIVFSYVGIFISGRRQRLAVQQFGEQMQHILRREKKLNNTVGLILIAFFLTFLPALTSPLILSTLGFSNEEFLPFWPFMSLFITLNGLLNPLLNYGRNANVRRAVLRLIRCTKHVARVPPNNAAVNQRDRTNPPNTLPNTINTDTTKAAP